MSIKSGIDISRLIQRASSVRSDNTPINQVSGKEREAFCYGIIGANRTGKSVTARALAGDWRDARPDTDKFEIIAHDPQRRFRDIANRLIQTHDEYWADRLVDENISNALVIIDELRMIHPKNQMSSGFKAFMAMAFENSVDTMYMVHSPALVLETLTYHTTNYLIFYTQSRLGTFQKKIPNYILCHQASVLVNKYVKAYGKGKHPEDKEYDGQDFPYVFVENETEKMTAINMNSKKVDNMLSIIEEE